MKNSTILLFSVTILLLSSQALSSNRFLARDDIAKENVFKHLPNSSAHEDNRTHENAPNNNSNNDSSLHHQQKGNEGSGKQAGNNSNFNNASAPQAAEANATRLLANNTNAGGRRNVTHAVRPRASAPSRNETEKEAKNGRKANKRAGGKAQSGNATHALNGENGEDSLEEVTRKLKEALDKAFKQGAEGRRNQGNGKSANGKGQKYAQGRNHANNGEDHFGGHAWNHEDGEEAFHAWNITKKA